MIRDVKPQEAITLLTIQRPNEGGKVSRWLELSFAEKVLLLEAWVLLLLADLTVRSLPFPWVRRLFLPAAGSRRGAMAPESVRGLARLVEIAAGHHLYPMTCLRRSLVLERWLLQRGLDAELKIGVQRDGAHLRAHAWVEHAGQAVASASEPSDFVPLLGAC